ncbi:MAG TPA: DegQ family serine endoprotease [Vicinamibacterales bacterium]|nr:DegQ family serine endoprotease [Vicinamibacterales bacterium]
MSRSFVRSSALVLGLGLASAGVWSATPAAPKTVEAAVSTASATAAPATGLAHDGYADIVAKVTPAVVTIRVEGKAQPQFTQLPLDPFGEFFGQRAPRGRQMPPQLQRGMGSGVIVSGDGYILTNNHVIDNATKIQVELSDRRVFEAKMVGADPASDLAVVKIDAKNLPVIGIGDSNAMRVGDVVLAVGNPLGVGQTVTMGILSAKGRATGLGDGSYEDFLQTDAAINQGNSGGALVNTAGQLIGINSQIMSPSGGNIGIGFAVPSNMAKNVMDQLITNGRVRRGLLGVTVQGVTGDLAAGLGLDKAEGALVSSVTPGGAADKAGIKRGDVILSYQGRAVVDTNAFRNEIAATKPGTTITLNVLRDGSQREVKATLEENPASRKVDDDDDDDGGGRSGRYGMVIEPLSPETARRLDLDDDVKGVVITSVEPAGAAAAAGLRPGDVIQQVNGRSVRTAEEVRSALNGATDKPAVLLIARGNTTIFVPLRAR